MAINNVGDSQQFDYTGDIQTFTITRKGLYKLEVWGGKGGVSSQRPNTSGGYGGKSSGYKVFDVGDVLYIVCGGGKNNTYNGGGNTPTGGSVWSGKGGGATHIASVTGTLVDIGVSNLDKIYIVAGGGGGQGESNTNNTNKKTGGSGGGSSGGNASGGSYNGQGGTQTSGGVTPNVTVQVAKGTFGKGGDAEPNPAYGAFLLRET